MTRAKKGVGNLALANAWAQTANRVPFVRDRYDGRLLKMYQDEIPPLAGTPRLGARGRHPHFVRLARSLAPNPGSSAA
jgi:hypothetical protein